MEDLKHTAIICPNCEKEFSDEFHYCPHCGQKNKQQDLKLRDLLNDFIESSFNLDSKIFHTLRLLIFYPGKLTHLFFEGKRTSYIPPVRLYLIISLIYFTVLSLVGTDMVKIKEDGKEVAVVSDSANDIAPSSEPLFDDMITDGYDSIADTTQKSLLSEIVTDRMKKLRTKQGNQKFTQMFRKYSSVGMFVLMPLTALIFFLLFMKGTYYIQHLVFVLHLQSAMFILFTVFNLFELLLKSEWVDLVMVIMFLMLLFNWVKKYYLTSWFKAVLKSFLFLTMYFIVFGIFITVVGAISAWNL